MRVFGRKVTGNDVKAFGRKIADNASVFGRKLVNTVDKIAPLAQVISTVTGHPEIAMGIAGIQGAVHAGDSATRAGVGALTNRKGNFNEKVVNFGEKLGEFKQQTNDLLQQN